MNFCPSCGADLKNVAYRSKSNSEKIDDLLKQRRSDLGSIGQLKALEWFEKGETMEDKITRMACYVNALELDATNVKAYNNLGVLYDEKMMDTQAVYCFRKALEIDSGYSIAMNNLAKCLAEWGKCDDAAEYYKKALVLEDKNAAIHRNYGDLLFKMKKYDESISEYKRAQELDPDGISGRVAGWKIELINKRFKDGGKQAATPVEKPAAEKIPESQKTKSAK
ncbi:MAG TPA: tetratricopeptide repeat protein [Candidatus Wallbacteria bacterium]|nr:tetratricopeptide repeat protein [Candidatus Wallbacteria bacterium]